LWLSSTRWSTRGMSRNDDFNGPEQDGVDGYQLTHRGDTR